MPDKIIFHRWVAQCSLVGKYKIRILPRTSRSVHPRITADDNDGLISKPQLDGAH